MFDHHTRTCILENVSPKMPLNGGHPDAHHTAKDGNPHHEQLGLCHLSATQYVILPLHHVSITAYYWDSHCRAISSFSAFYQH